MVSMFDLLVISAWFLAMADMLRIGSLHRLCQRLGFQAFTLAGPNAEEAEPVANLAKVALKAKPTAGGAWLVRPLSWAEHGPGASIYPFCGVGILTKEGGVWTVRVRGGLGIALFFGILAAAPPQGLVENPHLLKQLGSGAVVTAAVLVVQTVEARRVFGRIW